MYYFLRFLHFVESHIWVIYSNLVKTLPFLNPGSIKRKSRTVGGVDLAGVNEFPWQGFLHISTNEGDYSCGCTLLDDIWFVTAAHCTKE